MNKIRIWIERRKTGCRKVCPSCGGKNAATARDCRCGADLRKVKRVYAGKCSSWAVRWADPQTGQKRSESTGPDKSFALHVAGKRRHELEAGEISGLTPITYDKFVTEHLMTAEDVLSYETVIEHERTLKQFKAVCGPVNLTVIDFNMLERFRDARKADGIAPATVNKVLRQLQSILERAKKRRYIRENPFVGNRKALFVPVPERVMRIVPAHDVKKVLSVCPDDYWLAIITLAFWSGMRRGEILRLQWPDVDFEGHNLHVCNKPGETTKSKRNRVVPMTSQVEAALEKLLSGMFKSQWVFSDGEGRRMSYNLDSNFNAIMARAGFMNNGRPNFTLHDLRKSCATELHRLGVPPKTIQRILGHADLTTTMNYYVEVDEKDMRAAMDKFGGAG